jgi:hypothetical protein
MAEKIVNGYKRFFEVRILNHYWLDQGKTVFDSWQTDIKRNNRLLNYDVRNILSASPTIATERQLKVLHCIFRDTSMGFVVAVPENIIIPDDTSFEFVLTVQNPDFYNYTALTLPRRKIQELYHTATNAMHRYKENVFLFSNKTGTKKTINGKAVLFLSRPIPIFNSGSEYNAENFTGSATKLFQALLDKPSAPPSNSWQEFTDPDKLPVFAHQDDIPDILMPDGTHFRGIELKDGISDNVFALIRIEKLDALHSHRLMDDLTYRSPVFEIHFKNRSTFWKYFKKKSGTFDSIETDPLPLTYFGNAGTKQKPAPGCLKAVFKNNDSSKGIIKILSEVYI